MYNSYLKLEKIFIKKFIIVSNRVLSPSGSGPHGLIVSDESSESVSESVSDETGGKIFL